jgi:hypothetical protein
MQRMPLKINDKFNRHSRWTYILQAFKRSYNASNCKDIEVFEENAQRMAVLPTSEIDSIGVFPK